MAKNIHTPHSHEESPRPTSLDEFAKSQNHAPGATERWFAAHPGVREVVIDGFAKHNVMVIWRWLKQEYGYSLSPESLRGFRDRQSR